MRPSILVTYVVTYYTMLFCKRLRVLLIHLYHNKVSVILLRYLMKNTYYSVQVCNTNEFQN